MESTIAKCLSCVRKHFNIHELKLTPMRKFLVVFNINVLFPFIFYIRPNPFQICDKRNWRSFVVRKKPCIKSYVCVLMHKMNSLPVYGQEPGFRKSVVRHPTHEEVASTKHRPSLQDFCKTCKHRKHVNNVNM